MEAYAGLRDDQKRHAAFQHLLQACEGGVPLRSYLRIGHAEQIAGDQPRLYIRIPVFFEKVRGKTAFDKDVNNPAQVMMSPITAADFIGEDSRQVVGLRYMRVMRTVRPLCLGTWEIHAWLVEALAPAVCQMTTSGNFPEFIDPIGPFA